MSPHFDQFFNEKVRIIRFEGEYPLAVISYPFRRETHYKSCVFFNIKSPREDYCPSGFELRYVCYATISGKRKYHCTFDEAVSEIENYSGDIKSVVAKYTDIPVSEQYAYTQTKVNQGIANILYGFHCTPNSPINYYFNSSEMKTPSLLLRKKNKRG